MSRKTQIGWMSVGVLLSLFSIALAMKMRDGNKVIAQTDDKPAEARAMEAPAPFPPLPDAKPMPPKPVLQLPPPELFAPPIIRTSAQEPMPEPPVRHLLPEKVTETGKPLPPISFDPPLTPVMNPEGPPPAIKPDWTAPRPLAGPPGVPVEPRRPVAVHVPAETLKPTAVQIPIETTPRPIPIPEVPKPPIGTSTAFSVPNPSAPVPPLEAEPLLPIAETVKKEIVPVSATSKAEPGEPPMMVAKGPVVSYQVRGKTETLPDIARRTLGTSERWTEIAKLNPELKPDTVLAFGTTVKLPADACLQDDTDTVKPLPALHAKTTAKPKVLPLTGTYPCNMDDQKNLTLPKAIREQFGNSDTLLVSPGADHCLWITNHAHLERMAERIEHSPAREVDVRVFKRLYYAQTEKATVTAEGRINISDKLTQFAGLGQEMVLVGIDEHFELWDAARWKQYTQQKSAAARASVDE